MRGQEYVIEAEIDKPLGDGKGFLQRPRSIIQPWENMGVQVYHARLNLRLTAFRRSLAVAGIVAASSFGSGSGDMFPA